MKAARNKKLLTYALAGVAVLIAGAGISVRVLDQMARAEAVDRIVECGHLRGFKTLDADFVNGQIDLGMTQTGKGWREGEEYAALVAINSGLLDLGACFTSKETSSSN